MTLKLELSRAARIDFDEAADFYGGEDEQLSLRFIEAVDAALALVQRSPHSYPIVFGTHVRKKNVATFPFVIHYTVDLDRIYVFSVFHTSRNPIIWRGRID